MRAEKKEEEGPTSTRIRGTFFACCAYAGENQPRARRTKETIMIVFLALPACLLLFIAGCPEPFFPLTQDAVEMSIESCRMSRRIRLLMVTVLVYDSPRDKEKMDEVAREYVATHDPEIVEELYRLARELEKMA